MAAGFLELVDNGGAADKTSRRRVSEGIRPSLGDRQARQYLTMPIGSLGSGRGTSAAAETGSGGWGEGGEEDMCGEGSPQELSRFDWFMCSAGC